MAILCVPTPNMSCRRMASNSTICPKKGSVPEYRFVEGDLKRDLTIGKEIIFY